MKDHSSFVSWILSFSLTTISEINIRGFYYLSICVAIKLEFIHRWAVHVANLLRCLGSDLLWELEMKSARGIFSSRGYCLIFFHLAEIIFSLGFSFWKLGKRKRMLQMVLGCFFVFVFILIHYSDKSAM